MLDARRKRNIALVKELKARLGIAGFKQLQSISIDFQHGEVAVDDYYSAATNILQDDARLLVEMLSILPDLEIREQALRFHQQHTATNQLANQMAALANASPATLPCTAASSSPAPSTTTSAPATLLQSPSSGRRAGSQRSEPDWMKASAKTKDQKSRTEVSILQEGLVLLRRCLSPEAQQWLVNESFRLGDGEEGVGGGFYKQEGKMMKLNHNDKGRVIAPISEFPPKYKEECDSAVALAMQHDPSIPSMSADVVLVNFYSDRGSLPWHRDNDAGKALTDLNLGKPVVSFSVGDAADFGYKWHHEDTEKVVRLESGDCIIFGGPSRMILHSLLRIYPNTKPRTLKMRMGRLNITFRDHSEVEDHEINLGFDGENRLENAPNMMHNQKRTYPLHVHSF